VKLAPMPAAPEPVDAAAADALRHDAVSVPAASEPIATPAARPAAKPAPTRASLDDTASIEAEWEAAGLAKKRRWPIFVAIAVLALGGFAAWKLLPPRGGEPAPVAEPEPAPAQPAPDQQKVAEPQPPASPEPAAAPSPDASVEPAAVATDTPPPAEPSAADAGASGVAALAQPEPTKPADDNGARPAVATDEVPVAVPAAGHLDPDAEYKRLVASGNKSYARNKVRLAASEFRKALDLKPDGAEAQLGLGLSLVETSPKAAIPYLEKGLAKQPGNARAYVFLGTAYQTLGRNAEARKAYEKYLALDPNGEYAGEVRMILKDLK
jgi:tetratricopeptide (TPR) repeat protein